jgi:hypothetical protein
MELLMIYKSPLAPLFQREEGKDPHDYAKTLNYYEFYISTNFGRWVNSRYAFVLSENNLSTAVL